MEKNKNRGQSILGSSEGRPEGDFYPTKPPTTRALLEVVDFEGSILEPACGNGAMSNVLIEKYGGDNVISSDLYDRGFGDVGIDFLTLDENVKYDNIITNPPYILALDFLIKAKKIATKKIALLLKFQFLEGKKRLPYLTDKNFPLSEVYMFTKRQEMTRNGEEMKNRGMMTFAWFVWDKSYTGEAPLLKLFDFNAGEKTNKL